MKETNINPVLDFKTMAAILTANPDGVAMLGAWNGMQTLAAADPEGCVRLTPYLPMDTAMLANFFHCAVDVVEKTVAVFEKMHRLTVRDGLISILGSRNHNVTGGAAGSTSPGDACKTATQKAVISDEALAKKREQARLRQAAYRARKRLSEKTGTKGDAFKTARTAQTKPENGYGTNNTAPSGEIVNDKTDDSCHDIFRDNCHDKPRDKRDSLCDSAYNGCDSACNACDRAPQIRQDTAFPQPVTGRDTVCDTDTAVNKSIDNKQYASSSSSSSLAHEPMKIIPLKNLEEKYRNVVTAWNKLPLAKYRGMTAALLENVKTLWQQYGEQTVLSTIEKIANCPFLLGQKENKGWKISLAWLLDPANFAKVLSGKYEDTERNCNYGGNTDESWLPAEDLDSYLHEACKERCAAEETEYDWDDLLKPVTPAQKEAAELLGIAA